MLENAASAIWREQGWAGVTMRGVCGRAGLTDRYFYENFADRDALLADLWDRTRDLVMARVLKAFANSRDGSPLERLRAGLVAVVDQLAAEPLQAQILFGDHAGSAVLEQRRREAVQAAADMLTGELVEFALPSVERERLRFVALMGIGGFVELMLARQAGAVDLDVDSFVERLMETVAAMAAPYLRGAALPL